MMPDIPISSPLSYVGVFLLIFGFFLILSGFRVIKVERITVTPGTKTWILGIFLAVIGVVFLLPDIFPPSSDRDLPSTPTEQATPSVSAPDVDVNVYDDFNDPSYDGEFDRSKWRYEGEFPELTVQQDGALAVRKAEASAPPRMHAREYQAFTIDAPMFFETEMMLSPDERTTASISFNIQFDLLSGEYWWMADCGIIEDGPWAFCSESASWTGDASTYESEDKPIDWGEWHTFRIEIDPSTMTFSYYIDGQSVGSHIPDDSEKLQQADVSVFLEVHADFSEPVTAYYDNVRIGPLQDIDQRGAVLICALPFSWLFPRWR